MSGTDTAVPVVKQSTQGPAPAASCMTSTAFAGGGDQLQIPVSVGQHQAARLDIQNLRALTDQGMQQVNHIVVGGQRVSDGDKRGVEPRFPGLDAHRLDLALQDNAKPLLAGKLAEVDDSRQDIVRDLGDGSVVGECECP